MIIYLSLGGNDPVPHPCIRKPCFLFLLNQNYRTKQVKAQKDFHNQSLAKAPNVHTLGTRLETLEILLSFFTVYCSAVIQVLVYFLVRIIQFMTKLFMSSTQNNM